MGRFDDAETTIDQALDAYDKMPERNIHHAAALSTKATLLYRAGNYAQGSGTFPEVA